MEVLAKLNFRKNSKEPLNSALTSGSLIATRLRFG